MTLQGSDSSGWIVTINFDCSVHRSSTFEIPPVGYLCCFARRAFPFNIKSTMSGAQSPGPGFHIDEVTPSTSMAIKDQEWYGIMTKVLIGKVNSKLSQKEASSKEIDEALKSVMSPQQYSEYLTLSKALKEMKSTGSQNQPNVYGTHEPGWDSSPDAIRLRLISEATIARSRWRPSGPSMCTSWRCRKWALCCSSWA